MRIASIDHLSYLLKCKTSEKELTAICEDLTNKDFLFDHKYYREKREESLTASGKKKIRIINPSNGRLNIIQENIKRAILDKIEFGPYVQGGVTGKSNISNAGLHLGNKFKFTTDIKRFFPSIKPQQVYTAFYNLVFNPEVARILTILTTYKGKVPQGASTSSHIANITFQPIDLEIYSFCKSNNLTYSRFIDDITVSSPTDFKHLIDTIIHFITDRGFTISTTKTFYGNIIDVTGIEVKNNTMKPNDKFYRKLEQATNPDSISAKKRYESRVKSARKNNPKTIRGKLSE